MEKPTSSSTAASPLSPSSPSSGPLRTFEDLASYVEKHGQSAVLSIGAPVRLPLSPELQAEKERLLAKRQARKRRAALLKRIGPPLPVKTEAEADRLTADFVEGKSSQRG